MRIVLDGQILQSRGLSDDSFEDLVALFRTLAAGWQQHDIFMVLNGQLPERIRHIRTGLAGSVPRANIRLWYCAEPFAVSPGAEGWQVETAMIIREGLLASLDPDVVIVPIDLERVDDFVFSIVRLASIPTIVCLEGAPDLARFMDGDAAAHALSQLSFASQVFLHGDQGGTCAGASDLDPAVTKVDEGTTGIAVALLEAVEALSPRTAPIMSGKPRLAFVSPLPPERSGISFYSAELLPAISRHYEIDLIVNQKQVADGPWTAGLAIRDIDWFADNAGAYDRILYHVGNSNFHRHMFAMLERHPGIVVLHDFFLSGVVADMDTSGYQPGNWVGQLYDSHGYNAASERYLEKHPVDVVWRYPCSGAVQANALGLIVHADSTKDLARRWHGAEAERRVTVIPHLRAERPPADKHAARKALGLADSDFVVCAFGGMGPTKLNHRLVDAWFASRLSRDPNCALVFVGSPEGGHYGRALAERIRGSGGDRIKVTGWADDERFQLYLSACDVAVQLRALSRGETSGTVLDCMNGGVPLIVNAHGSMADLPQGTSWMLEDSFEDNALVDALETLERDGEKRASIARCALDHIRRNNNPDAIAAQYAAAIEGFMARPRSSLTRLAPALGKVLRREDRTATEAVAACAALSIQPSIAARQILVDVSAIARHDLHTGIERAVRALLRAMIASPPDGYRIEPVYARETGFLHARRFAMDLLRTGDKYLTDEPVDLRAGDIYFMPDLHHDSVIRNRATYQAMRDHGVSTSFMVHDLLPVQFPHFFPPVAEGIHGRWLEVVAEADQVICVSRAVADEFTAWLNEHGALSRPHVTHSHHGADINASKQTLGLPKGADVVLDGIAASRTFLMVGTVEPRKGHAQVLDAFEYLWAAGAQERLVIVGKPGWMLNSFVSRMRKHREKGRRLLWIEGASDEYLTNIYKAATCLIAASHGEGFGLPLIEAAAHGLPILARDIPVFREVAGAHAVYFDAATPKELADAIKRWVALHLSGEAPASSAMPTLTWADSAANLQKLLVDGPL